MKDRENLQFCPPRPHTSGRRDDDCIRLRLPDLPSLSSSRVTRRPAVNRPGMETSMSRINPRQACFSFGAGGMSKVPARKRTSRLSTHAGRGRRANARDRQPRSRWRTILPPQARQPRRWARTSSNALRSPVPSSVSPLDHSADALTSAQLHRDNCCSTTLPVDRRHHRFQRRNHFFQNQDLRKRHSESARDVGPQKVPPPSACSLLRTASPKRGTTSQDSKGEYLIRTFV